jgi:hypothetical protein
MNAPSRLLPGADIQWWADLSLGDVCRRLIDQQRILFMIGGKNRGADLRLCRWRSFCGCWWSRPG